MRANMDQHDLCRQTSAVPFFVQWTPRTALFLLFMCDNLSGKWSFSMIETTDGQRHEQRMGYLQYRMYRR